MKLRPEQWIIKKEEKEKVFADFLHSQEDEVFSTARKIWDIQYDNEVLLDNDVWYLLANPENLRLATEDEIKEAKIHTMFNQGQS